MKTALDRSMEWTAKVHEGLEWRPYEQTGFQPQETVGASIYVELRDGSCPQFPIDADDIQWGNWPDYPQFDIIRYAIPSKAQPTPSKQQGED